MSNSELIVIKVSDFTVVPGARHVDDGEGSAEEFFKDFVQGKVDENPNSVIQIDFDGTWGYASSFISELAKDIKTTYGADFIKDRLLLKSDEDLMLIDRFKHELRQSY